MFGIENQQNRSVTFGFMKNRAYDFFAFLSQIAAKSISFNRGKWGVIKLTIKVTSGLVWTSWKSDVNPEMKMAKYVNFALSYLVFFSVCFDTRMCIFQLAKIIELLTSATVKISCVTCNWVSKPVRSLVSRKKWWAGRSATGIVASVNQTDGSTPVALRTDYGLESPVEKENML